MLMATQIKHWTLDELHSLPDDGNKYELIHGELFLTPAPTNDHETVLARLTDTLGPYVRANGLGRVYHPRAVVRLENSEVEPDLMVRREAPGIGKQWENAPLPILIVEVFSPFTRRRDQTYKRDFYMNARIAEYWMVDIESRTVTIVRPNEQDQIVDSELAWRPSGPSGALVIQLTDIFP